MPNAKQRKTFGGYFVLPHPVDTMASWWTLWNHLNHLIHLSFLRKKSPF